MVFTYKLGEEFEDKYIIVVSDKKYTEKEFNDLITDVCTEYWGETDTIDEIAEVLVENYGFDYLDVDVSVFFSV